MTPHERRRLSYWAATITQTDAFNDAALVARDRFVARAAAGRLGADDLALAAAAEAEAGIRRPRVLA